MSVHHDLEAIKDVAIHEAKQHNCNYNIIISNPHEGEFSKEHGSTYEFVADSYFEKERPNAKLLHTTDELRGIIKPLAIQDLATEIHGNMTKSGFWTPRPHQHQQLMLIIAELCEAVEAGRVENRKVASIPLFKEYEQDLIKDWEATYPDPVSDDAARSFFIEAYKLHIKETVEEELADTGIRALDLLGSLGEAVNWEEAQDHYEYLLKSYQQDPRMENITIWALTPTFWISGLSQIPDFVEQDDIDMLIGYLLKTLAYLHAYQPDLGEHIRLKTKYNLSRPAKHGKTH